MYLSDEKVGRLKSEQNSQHEASHSLKRQKRATGREKTRRCSDTHEKGEIGLERTTQNSGDLLSLMMQKNGIEIRVDKIQVAYGIGGVCI